MLNLLLFLVQIIIIFLLARAFARNFFRFWLLITKSKNWAMRLSGVFLLPGTLIHELSHWVVAEILQVPTGSMNLWPEFHEEGGIRMGSVKIARSDPFRRTLIGLAPTFVGLGVISVLVQFLPSPIWSCLELNCIVITLTIVFSIFLISNTMFSSKKDMEAAFVPFVILIIFGLAWWWFSWSLPQIVLRKFDNLFELFNQVFAVVIVINGIFLVVVKAMTKISGKILNRRIIEKKTF